MSANGRDQATHRGDQRLRSCLLAVAIRGESGTVYERDFEIWPAIGRGAVV